MKRYVSSAVAIIAMLLSVMMLDACSAPTPEESLKQMIEEANKECPTNIDHVTTLKQIKLDGDYVTYVCEIDETQLEMDTMIGQRAIYEQNIRNTMAYQLTDNSANKEFFKLVIEAGKGLRHQYVGRRSGKDLVVDVPNSELKQMAAENDKKAQ